MLTREIACGFVDDSFAGIPVAEFPGHAVVVRYIEGVEEVREHFSAPFQMQYMQEGIRKSIWQRQWLYGPDNLRVVPSIDSARPEIAHIGDDFDE